MTMEWDGTLEPKEKKVYKAINIETLVADDFKALARKNNVTHTEMLVWLIKQARENWERKQAETGNGS